MNLVEQMDSIVTRTDALETLRTAIRHRWKIPPQLFSILPTKMLQIIAQSPRAGDQVRAAKIIMEMTKYNLEASIYADKIHAMTQADDNGPVALSEEERKALMQIASDHEIIDGEATEM